MFLVFNKEKISAYIVSILTVCFLFFIANTIPAKDNSTPTSTNIEKINNMQNMNNTVNKRNNIQ